MNGPARALRLARLFVDYKRRKTAGLKPPIRLWVESSSHCNFRCAMCLNKDMKGEQKGHMSFELFTKIVDEAKCFANDIYLHHRGEPFLNPKLFDMIRYAREAGLRTRFHTNGSLIDGSRAQALLDARPNLVSVSIDGFDKDVYERIRAGGAYGTTVENVLGLLELRRERGQTQPYVVVEKIDFKKPDPGETAEKIEALTRRFMDAGLDELIKKEEYVWAAESAPEPDGTLTYSCCTFPWYAMVVCWDGTVTPCPQDFWAHLKMGDAGQASLRAIWDGAAYRDLRRRLVSDIGSLALCRKCDRLRRKRVGGIPLQYLVTFLADQLLGYGRLRKWIGTFERN
ncbi:MAG: radical SAM protein [Kiritimatiellae bacterium]|nr:radical SAM protein [Kiritimatiellia bacterium]